MRGREDEREGGREDEREGGREGKRERGKEGLCRKMRIILCCMHIKQMQRTLTNH